MCRSRTVPVGPKQPSTTMTSNSIGIKAGLLMSAVLCAATLGSVNGECTFFGSGTYSRGYSQSRRDCQREECKVQIKNNAQDYFASLLNIESAELTAEKIRMDGITAMYTNGVGSIQYDTQSISNYDATYRYRDIVWIVSLFDCNDDPVTDCYGSHGRRIPGGARPNNGRCTGEAVCRLKFTSPTAPSC